MSDTSDMTPARFMIIAQARSGSTFLRELLNAQPGVVCHGEVFSRVWIDRMVPRPGHEALTEQEIRALLPRRDADPVGVMNEYFLDFPGQVAGFKVIYEDFLDPRFDEALTLFARQSGMKIIHLWRQNRLAGLVSRLRMSRFGLRHSDVPRHEDGTETPRLITVDRAELDRYVRHHDLQAQRIDERFPDALQVRYETLRDDFPRIMAHIGLPGQGNFASPLRKLAAQDLSEIIENHAELREFDYPPQPVW